MVTELLQGPTLIIVVAILALMTGVIIGLRISEHKAQKEIEEQKEQEELRQIRAFNILWHLEQRNKGLE
ncbi:hypothetical protein [Corynebacterium sp.]|uniref:hypothetical protein n=1 Tax=Corynebacterium sp. TaxID=1720 RepID=UPI0028A6C547|nr:hypothetical protein [Corynebacterium sp.]